MSQPTSTFDIDSLADAIQSQVRALPSPDTASLREVRRAFSKQIAPATPAEVLALAHRLIASDDFTFRWLAYELIAFHKPTLRSLEVDEIERLGQGMDRWEAVDTFAPYLAGVAWREGQISDEVIHRWAQSEDRWWRRAALVSTIALNTKARGGRGDVPRTLAVCRLLIADKDDMVVKALSWALRELIPYDPNAVQAFLNKHEDVLAARVLRETRNKLKTGLKNPRL